MFNILTLNKISQNGLKYLDPKDFTIADDIADPDGIILRSYSMHDMELPASLKAVARAGAGVNNIPLDKCAEKGIVVFNTPGANANAVKELAICALLMTSRKIPEGIAWAQSLKGQEGVAALVEKGKSAFVGPELSGKTLGVIGLGAIGVLVANAARTMGMEVIGFDPFLSVDAAWHISRGVHKAASLEEVYAESDYLSVHVPYNKDTKYMINDEAMAVMKDGVRIINLSRAELVDTEAIKRGIASGKVAAYAVDFPTDDVLGVDGIIPIPHLGASTPESEENCAEMAAQELRNFLLTGEIRNSVNFPNCEMPWSGKRRICVTHKNVPKVLGSITTVLADDKINIDNMLNKSKGDYAYTMIDIDQNDTEGIEESLLQVSGVITVRVI